MSEKLEIVGMMLSCAIILNLVNPQITIQDGSIYLPPLRLMGAALADATECVGASRVDWARRRCRQLSDRLCRQDRLFSRAPCGRAPARLWL